MTTLNVHNVFYDHARQHIFYLSDACTPSHYKINIFIIRRARSALLIGSFGKCYEFLKVFMDGFGQHGLCL